MKIIFWMLVIAGAIMLVRRYGALAAARARRDAQAAAGQSAADAASPARPADADMMVACSICDLHLPASEAIFAHGRVYCCEAHQAQGKAAQSGQRLK